MPRMRIRSGAILLLMLTFAAVLTVGCQSIAEKVVEETTGVKVEDEGEKVTITGEDGETMELSGTGGSLPKDWPSDMPVYDGATIDSSAAIRSGEVTNFSVALSTTDAFADVFAWYKEQLASEGWTIDNEFDMETDGSRAGSFTSTKGSMTGYVWISEEDDGIVITLQVTEE